ncbi:MAG TPA: HAD-IA family hydrolase [Vicinamibacterales bacterium]|nr:HAD-IA family hydrolase [Vicinamibacterales bacterium]
MIRAVLFDLDDTLFDHHRSARAALQEVHRAHASQFDFAAFERHHTRYLEEMHLEVLARRVGLDDARRERFRKVFEALGVALGPTQVDAVASAYRDGYMLARRPLEGAADLLGIIKASARVVIVTNNLLDEQQDKLEYCGLATFVDVLVASENVGVSKPQRGIFDIALESAGVAADSAVMIGDSWANDIVGARNAEIPAIWFNPERKTRPEPLANVREIHSLTPAADIARIVLS